MILFCIFHRSTIERKDSLFVVSPGQPCFVLNQFCMAVFWHQEKRVLDFIKLTHFSLLELIKLKPVFKIGTRN